MGAYLLDISKYFDSINHIILSKKLEMYGIIGTELNWFSSYLNGRKQFFNFKHPSPVELHAVFHKGQFLALPCFYCSLMASPILQ